MTRKSALYGLAVAAALVGAMAISALADEQWNNTYGPGDSSVSAPPEQGVEQPGAGEVREPMETGAVPDPQGESYDRKSNPTGDEPAEEFGGQVFRLGIDTGP